MIGPSVADGPVEPSNPSNQALQPITEGDILPHDLKGELRARTASDNQLHRRYSIIVGPLLFLRILEYWYLTIPLV